MKYVAFLRGIMPMNPNMRNEKICVVFEKLGFKDVKAVIASGNILFETSPQDTIKLEAMIEKALAEELGFKSTTLKNKPKTTLTFPYRIENKGYEILGIYDEAVCSVIDVSGAGTSDFMVWLEKQFGREITTRTWKTISKILAKFD